MKTSQFLNALRSHSTLPLVFRAGDTMINAGYHLTEVKDVTFRTMDCGAKIHEWAETHFELWSPKTSQSAEPFARMDAGKFIAIVDRVQAQIPFPSDSATRVFAAFGEFPAAVYDVRSAAVEDDQLVVELVADRARCKAAERNTAAAAKSCCGTGATESSCGCGADSKAELATACCG